VNDEVYGTITWLVRYEKDGDVDYRSFHITGGGEESIKHSLVLAISREGWKIITIEEVINTFRFGGRNG
jgi:hypothetical protein